MTALLLIKPCNISPKPFFVFARQLMSSTLSQRETKAQRTRFTLRKLRPEVKLATRKQYFQNQLSLCGGTDRLQHRPSSYAFSINWIFHLDHPSCSCSCGSMGQSCCHCEYQKEDLDGLYHPQLTNWGTFTGQMRNSSRAAAVMNNTRGYECRIAKLSLHIRYEKRKHKYNCFL